VEENLGVCSLGVAPMVCDQFQKELFSQHIVRELFTGPNQGQCLLFNLCIMAFRVRETTRGKYHRFPIMVVLFLQKNSSQTM